MVTADGAQTTTITLPADCPPADALDADMLVYYVAKVNPCHADDFRSHAERGSRKDADPCNRCGLSVWRDETDARWIAMKFPRLGQLIARGQLEPAHGKLKKTYDRSHHTWWPVDGLLRHSVFSVIGTATTP